MGKNFQPLTPAQRPLWGRFGKKNQKKVKKISRAMQRFASLLHHIYRRREESPSPHRPNIPTFEQKRVVRKQEAILTQVRYPNRFCRDCFFKTKFRPTTYQDFPVEGISGNEPSACVCLIFLWLAQKFSVSPLAVWPSTDEKRATDCDNGCPYFVPKYKTTAYWSKLPTQEL